MNEARCIVDKRAVRAHPFYRWEAGYGRHLFRMSRLTQWMSWPIGLTSIAVTVFSSMVDYPAHKYVMLVVGVLVPLLLFSVHDLRMNSRLLAARRSGFLRDIYLTGSDPVVSFAAFYYGASQSTYSSPYLLAMGVGYILLGFSAGGGVGIIVTAIVLLFTVLLMGQRLFRKFYIMPVGSLGPLLMPHSETGQAVRSLPIIGAFMVWPTLFALDGVGFTRLLALGLFILLMYLATTQGKFLLRISDLEWEKLIVAYFLDDREELERLFKKGRWMKG